jgi:hypothetical protein
MARRGSRSANRSWNRRFGVARMPAYARVAIPILLLALFGRLAWQGTRTVLHRTTSSSAAYANSGAGLGPGLNNAPMPPWQRDFMDSLASGARDGTAGSLSAAEMDVDRAESFVTSARLESRDAQPEFFASSLAALDLVAQQAPQNQRLFDHVTQARIALAELRSSENPMPSPNAGSAVGSQLAPDIAKPLSIAAPREFAANSTLDPQNLRSNYLDATLMPDTSEILLPPTSRSFADNMRVENLTIAGAAQTLDGIHWRNVTFIGTRLRYESGELDLQNVHFVRCRFGFSSDDRGARLANAVASGQTSVAIQ